MIDLRRLASLGLKQIAPDNFRGGSCPRCQSVNFGVKYFKYPDSQAYIFHCFDCKHGGQVATLNELERILRRETLVPAESLEDYCQDVVPVEWAVQDFLPLAHRTMLAAYPGHMKTWLALYIGVCVATGSPCFNHETKQLPVYYLDREGTKSQVSSRTACLGRPAGFNIWSDSHVIPPPMITEKDKVDKYYLRGIIEQCNPKPLFIFDTLKQFNRAKENDNNQMAEVMAAFKPLSAAGATVLILHHSGKAGPDGNPSTVRGASSIEGEVDLIWHMKKKDERGKVELVRQKTRFDHAMSRTLLLLTGGTSYKYFCEIENDAKDA